MKIAIIGIGNVGSALARGLAKTSHRLVLGVRDPSDAAAKTLAAEVKAELATPAEGAKSAELIILALPWDAAEAAVKALGDLSGKTVIDCINPLAMIGGSLALTLGHTTSAGETIAGWLPGAYVVKTLNQVGAEIMADNAGISPRPVMFMAGDHAEAKAKVATVLADLGFEPLDAGDITKARLLEPYGMVWINQAMFRGKGRNWAFAAVERT
ncbi:MAG TPA: NAD(P)-binding domain-containing protein [Bradyrhizobium sp.]|uniref:NADPH-dependent F420 reductase n=1 Tax=Bradyrhizobium sp. TaxID=376 RepID=UPI002C7AB41E|nr:NAD(P)-binding domain-containing protein [Bradyrhizobium sp.]HLZ03934.1 NAD(P)-binding domain-containing protein [Bradyrhizobium sp.]